MSNRKKYTIIGLIVAAIVGFIAFHQIEAASHKAEFCIICHNMQPEYDSYTKGNLLAKKHKDANVTCHAVHHPQKLNTCMSCHPIDWKVDSSWKMYPPTKK